MATFSLSVVWPLVAGAAGASVEGSMGTSLTSTRPFGNLLPVTWLKG